jgi:hypothetical protein
MLMPAMHQSRSSWICAPTCMMNALQRKAGLRSSSVGKLQSAMYQVSKCLFAAPQLL